jgi:hypothetical protein
VPVCDGYTLRHFACDLPINGSQLTSWMVRLRYGQEMAGCVSGPFGEHKHVWEECVAIKESSCCSVSPIRLGMDWKKSVLGGNLTNTNSTALALADVTNVKGNTSPASPMSRSAAAAASSPQQFVLPDGRTVAVADEAAYCAEALFQPGLILSVCPDTATPATCATAPGQQHSFALSGAAEHKNGIHRAAMWSYNQCDKSLQCQMAGAVVLSGGSSRFSGMQARLKSEMEALACGKQPGAQRVRMKVHAEPTESGGADLVWTGASCLASSIQAGGAGVSLSKAAYESSGAGAAWKYVI